MTQHDANSTFTDRHDRATGIATGAQSVSQDVASEPLVTIFAMPKPFGRETDLIQRNAVKSWSMLQPHVEVLLIGEEQGIAETAVDLPSLLAIVSSFRDRSCSPRLVSFGEIGLAGEIRPVRYGAERIAAAAKQGYTTAIVPRGNVPKKVSGDIEVIGVTRLRDALDAAF